MVSQIWMICKRIVGMVTLHLYIVERIYYIVERIYYEQLYAFFSDILSTFLAAFRKMYCCHHVLTKLLHDCKKALDEGLSVGIILMDLSKAFDCIPHGLLLTKLKCYGLSDQACLLLKSYISDRKQRVKVGHSRSEWGSVAQGVPQGSILWYILCIGKRLQFI